MSDITVENLQIEIESNANSAVNGIDALVASLGKIKNAVKGASGLNTISKYLVTLNSTLSSISEENASKLSKLTQGLSTLSSLKDIKLSSSVATQITNVGNAARSLDGVNFSVFQNLANTLTPLSTMSKANLNSFISQLTRLPQAIQALDSANIAGLNTQVAQLVSALQPLSEMGKNNLTSFITQLSKLPDLMISLQAVDIGALATKIKELANALAPLGTQMQYIAAGFSSFPTRIQRLITSTNNLTTANNKAVKSYVDFAAKIGVAFAAMRTAVNTIGSWITKTNEYIENINLFDASMGKYAEKGRKYADLVGDVMGIDPGEWMRNQGIFMNLATGFGVVGDRAYTMSKNLTQLGYDVSSFFNMNIEKAMQKLQSGLAGEVKSLRGLGYDISAVKLQQEAYTLGIKKRVSAMTQAEKTELRYYAILKQATNAQGDMARTLETPANQLRVLKAQVERTARALGSIFIPILNKVLPYAIAFTQVIRRLAEALARLMNFTLPEIDYSNLGSVSNSGGIVDTLDNAVKKAKELKNNLIGIDELNIISQNDNDSDNGLGGNGTGFDFDLPEYNFLDDAINKKVEEIMKKIQPFIDWVKKNFDDILKIAVGIGAAILAWKVADHLLDVLRFIHGLKSIGLSFSIEFAVLGAVMFLADINEFLKYFEDFKKNGATFHNVAGMISEFTGAVGDALIMLGSLKLGGALKVIQGIGEMIIAIEDVSKNNISWDNVTTAIRGLTNVAIGLGLFLGHIKVAAWAVALQGFNTIITELAKNWEAIRQGDWSGIDWVTVIIGGLQIVGGLLVAFDFFSRIKGITNVGKAAKTMETVSSATGQMDSAVGSLSPKLTSLAKNLGMGLIIIAEVAAAALLITGAIIVLGMGLEQVGIAWKPVIANGGTIATAMGLGIAVLGVIGVATSSLGTLGTTLMVNIALGAALLAELGVVAGLFLAEIWAIGKGLDEIGKAWQPVLNNGETIATGIGLGTALLIGIGVVTAALGVATVASAGLLPLAIGLGTALLVELAAATIIFTKSLVAVADELGNNLSPALDKLNVKLPTLSNNMKNFITFMTEFAGHVVDYTKVNVIAGLAATIDTIIGWFTTDPIQKLSNDVNKIHTQTLGLNEKLNLAVPELQIAINLLTAYATFLKELELITGSSGDISLSNGMFVNMREVGVNLVTGFINGIQSKSSDFASSGRKLIDEFTKGLSASQNEALNNMGKWANDLAKSFNDKLTTSSQSTKTGIIAWSTNIKSWFTQSSFGGINAQTFNTYATNVITGFNDKLNSNTSSTRTSVTTWATNIKNWFSGNSYGAVNSTTFGTYANNIVTGFNNAINSQTTSSNNTVLTWANNIKNSFIDSLQGAINATTWGNYAKHIVDGFVKGLNDYGKLATDAVEKWAQEIRKTFEQKLDINSPSGVFELLAMFTVEGYNRKFTSYGKSTYEIVSAWANKLTSISPDIEFAVDTSALRYYNSSAFAKSISANVTTNTHSSVDYEGSFKEAMVDALIESGLVGDMRRQADKDEQTLVQVGNRVVSDAVIIQQRANGYNFTHA